MVEKEVRILNRLGLHARPAILFVQKANEFPCEITIWKGEKQGNAKSISHLINLKIRQDDLIRLKARGDREEEALMALTRFLLSEELLSQDSG